MVFFAGISFSQISAQLIYVHKADSPSTPIGKYISYTTDAAMAWTANDVYEKATFVQSVDDAISLGFQSNRIWLKLEVVNQSDLENLLIEVRAQQLDSVELFSLQEGTFVSHGYNGTKVIYDEFNPDHVIPSYLLNMPKGKKNTYLLSVRSGEQLILPVTIATPEAASIRNQMSRVLFGMYIGIMLVMFLYNLVIFLIVKDKSYLFYVIYILFIGMAQASIAGYTKIFLWPNAIEFHNYSIILFSVIAGFGAIAFAQQFLDLKKNVPKINNGLKLFYVVYGVAAIGYLAGFSKLSYSLLNIGGMGVALYAIFFAALLSSRGFRSAKFYLVGWLFFLSGIIIFVLRNFGVLPFNFFTENAIQIGSATEAILLSIALADRINILKKEKEKSQAEALQISLDNQRIIREQNVLLEEKVEERTKDLTQANNDLSVAIKDLQDTQTQLVEAEKMASLGQLTAGVAHEINNPINFVSSNIKPLERDIQDIVSIIEKYDEISDDEKRAVVDKLKKDIDYEYLKEEVSMLLKGIQEGANRTVEIVQSLRNFSRLDEHDLKKANVMDGLDSTIVLLNSSMGGVINLIKDYGDVPEIDCYPGKLNQVFMNILSNSIYAIQSKFGTKTGGELRITTSHDENNVYVGIKDNGIGMSREILMKVFEPFFTSKPVGEGTGLGLSIVYKIIENHKGIIKVDSQEGEWTEFLITLPKIA